MRFRPRLAAAAAALATTVATVVLLAGATAAPAQADPPPNACYNPNLAVDTAGWGVITGGPGARVAEILPGYGSTPPSERYAFRVDSTVPGPRVYLPRADVAAGEVWGFGVASSVDAIAAAGSVRARIQVDWYGPGDAYLGHVDGPWQLVNYHPHGPRWIGELFTAPDEAIYANVTAELDGAGLFAGTVTPHSWALRACSYTLGELVDPLAPVIVTPEPTVPVTPDPTVDPTTVPPPVPTTQPQPTTQPEPTSQPPVRLPGEDS